MADEQTHEETMGQEEPIEEQTENTTTEEGSGIPVASEEKPRAEGEGKLFVGGLNWKTTEDGLRTYFETYGKLSDCIVMTEPHTTQSRGFGFVTFEDPANCQKVLDAGPHQIDERTIDPKLAVPRAGMHGDAVPEGENTKIFIGGLNPNATEESLKEHFNTFGPVSEVLLMYDRETQRPRGFGFVSFEQAATVKKLVDMKFVEIDGKSVEVKAAQPKSAMGDRFGGGYGGRGRGRGRGGYEGGRGYGGRGRGGYDDGYGGGYGRGGGGRGYGRGRGYDDYRPAYRDDYYGGGYGAPPRDYHGGGGYGAPARGGYERGGRGYDDYEGGYGGSGGRYASGGYDRAPERPSGGGRGGGRGGYGASSGSYSERGSSSGGYGAVGSSSADPYGDSQPPRQSAATEGYGGGGYSQGAEAGYGASAYASDGYGANAGYSNPDPYASTGSYGQTSGYSAYQQ